MQLSRPPRRNLAGTSAYPPKPDAVAGAAQISGLCHKRSLAGHSVTSSARASSVGGIASVGLLLARGESLRRYSSSLATSPKACTSRPRSRRLPPKSGSTCRLPARSVRCCSAALRRATPCRNCLRSTRGRKPKPSYSEERNTKTATVTATPMPTPRPAPIATPMPMLATAAPTPAPSTTPTNTLNGKAATPQREIFVPWLRFSTES